VGNVRVLLEDTAHMHTTDADVLIIGAGLSGIGMASQLTRLCPQKTYAILERR
jgi:monooxygenase